MAKISVVMPAYNAEKYIAEAIESILSQTFGDFEFIIINDCSKDCTEEIILSYDDPRIVYLKNEQNLGVAATLNRGLAVAKGEYIARMDADDISMPERFAKQVTYLDSHKDCGICGSNTLLFGESIETSPFVFSEKHWQICGDVYFNSPFAHPSVMMRANVLRQFNLEYDSAFEGSEDYNLWYHLLRVTKGHNIQEPLLRYRMHANQVTQKTKEKQFNTLQRMKYVMLMNCNTGFSDQEIELFTHICGGVRKITDTDYTIFVSCARKLIACVNVGKRQLMWNFAAINCELVKTAGVKHGKYISLADPMYKLLNFACKLVRAIK